jgi:hypothetical protein
LRGATGIGRALRGAGGQVSGVAVPFADQFGPQQILGVGPHRLGAVTLGDVALQRADGDGGVDDPAPAGILAGRGTDSAADRGERVRGAGREVGLLVTAFGDQLNVATGVGAHGAAGLALDLRFPVFEIGEPDFERHGRFHSLKRLCPAGDTAHMIPVMWG